MSAAEVFIEQGEDPGLAPVQMSEGGEPVGEPVLRNGPPSGQTAPADRDNAVEPEQVVGGSAAVPGRTLA